MSNLDFNDAEAQREGGLVPEGTVSLAVMALRSGGHGDGGWLAKSKSSGGDMLDVEFTLYGGKYERRKVWKYMSLHGDAGPVTRSQLRAALESAHGIDPADNTSQAASARKVSSYGEFNGLEVCIKIGIEKGKDGYPDKNILRAFVTSDRSDYIPPSGQTKPLAPAVAALASQNAAAATGGVAKPAWAK